MVVDGIIVDNSLDILARSCHGGGAADCGITAIIGPDWLAVDCREAGGEMIAERGERFQCHVTFLVKEDADHFGSALDVRFVRADWSNVDIASRQRCPNALRRVVSAMSGASSTDWVTSVVAIDQPTMRRQHSSSTTARYRKLPRSGCR